MRRLSIAASALACLCAFASTARATTSIFGTVSGPCGGQSVSADYVIEFTPTGGNYANGTGIATVAITLTNSTGVYGFQNPAIGNPVLTGFLFNIPPTANAMLTDAIVLAGSTISGSSNPGGCTTLAVNESRKSWYDLEEETAAGQFGIFANSLETARGIKGGLIAPAVMSGCTLLGNVFAPLYVAGQVRFVVTLTGLDTTLDTAVDFLKQCSTTAGDHEPFSLAAKFQATGLGGEGSCRVADPGQCQAVPTREISWGSVKSMYR